MLLISRYQYQSISHVQHQDTGMGVKLQQRIINN